MPRMSLLDKVFEVYNGLRVLFSQPEAMAAIASGCEINSLSAL